MIVSALVLDERQHGVALKSIVVWGEVDMR